VVTLPPEVVGEHLPEEIARWYGSWQNRYAAGRAALRRQALVARESASSPEEVGARALDKQMAAIDARLGATRAAQRETPTLDVATQLAALAGRDMLAGRYALRAEGQMLELRYAQAPSEHLPGPRPPPFPLFS